MPLSKEMIEDAMLESGGYVTEAADILGCSRQAMYNWFEKCPELNKTRRFAQRDLLDLAKKTARQCLLDGDKIMAIYILKSLGKDEGYTEKTEIDYTQAIPETVNCYTYVKGEKVSTNGLASNGAVPEDD